MLKLLRLAPLVGAITFALGFHAPAQAEGLDVVASFSIIGDLAKNVGGDRIKLTTIVGPDGDAHVYEPSPADATAMAKADVVLVNGLHFEGFLQRLVESSGTKASVVELTKGVTPIAFKPEFAEEDEGGESHGNIDPHAFQSIANARIYVANIADAFCAADASGCDSYRANAAAYTGKLEALETKVKDVVASIPADKRVIITSHDAFGYFEHEYGADVPCAGGHVDRGRAFGGRCRQADRPGQAGEGVGDLRREHHQHAADRADRLRDRPEDRRHALFRRIVAGRRPCLDLYRPDEAQYRNDQGRDPGELVFRRLRLCPIFAASRCPSSACRHLLPVEGRGEVRLHRRFRQSRALQTRRFPQCQRSPIDRLFALQHCLRIASQGGVLAMAFARLNGVVLHYDSGGTSDRLPLVFSNSLGTDFRIWDAVAARLAGRYRLIRYDKRGHGLSEAPRPPYAMADHVADLLALLDHLGIARSVIVGLSVGGVIAQGLAALHPERVAALVLSDTAHKIGTEASWNERIDAVTKDGIASIADTIMQRWFTSAYRQPDNPDFVGYTAMLTRTPVDGYAGTCAALRDADLTESTRALKMPALCIVGDQDGATPPDLVRSMANLIRNSEFRIIPDAGHLPCIEQPDAVAGLIGTFLRNARYG